MIDGVCPISRGLVTNMDLMEKLLTLVFEKLGVESAGCTVYMTEDVRNPPPFRQKIATMMFEKFEVEALRLIKAPQASIQHLGKLSALIVDCGH
jgi:actin-related protein